jgi:hypothetical protein
MRFAFLLFCTVLVCCDLQGGEAADPNPPLELKIAVPIHHQHRSLNDGDHFHVLVRNVSDQPIRLWTDRYSWGYSNLSFEIVGDDGKATPVRKKPRGWDKNYPDWLELKPGDTYVLNVNLNAADVWENPPRASGAKPTQLKLRAVYEITPDEQSAKLGVWTGKIQSGVHTYAIW